MQEPEFDRFADEYEAQHRRNIQITGEDPAYFAAYKIKILAEDLAGVPRPRLIDFGSGIGNSLPPMRQYIPEAQVTCADVSQRSLDLARTRFPGPERQLRIVGETIPDGDAVYDAGFSACVFHHIPHEEHVGWLAELARVIRPGGTLTVFEHNPVNPLTVRAVNTCEFDVNARLIAAPALARAFRAAGWSELRTRYHVFFPRALARLRWLEPSLAWLPLGGQYSIMARRPG